MYDTVIHDGTIVTATETFQASLAVTDGRIAGLLSPDHSVDADREISATGKYILPGGVDPHVHMMDPGDTDREDFPTGTAAAAAGGITTIGEHHRTDPTVLSADVLKEKRDYLQPRARIDFALLAGGHPDNVDEIEDLENEGAVAYKSFTCNVHGVPALESGPMKELFEEVERVGGISMVHPEDESLLTMAEHRLRKDGKTDVSAISEWRSKLAEQVAVETTLAIAEHTGVPLWFAHLSHPDVVDRVTRARNRGVDAYRETCPQYLYLTEDDIVADGPETMFTPPARTATDCEGLWTRLARGEIDMVNADHAPSTREQKASADTAFDAPFGIPGVETVLPLLLNGVHHDRVSLNRVVEVFSTNPAKITDLYPRKGSLAVGSDADFVIVDLEESQTLRDEDVVAKCGWTPYDGMTVTGIPKTTYVRGEPIFADGDVIGGPGYGEFVPRR